MGIFKRKCKFAKYCKLYDKNSVTCNEDGGDYYGPGRMGGCGRDFQEKGTQSEYFKIPDEKTNTNRSSRR